MSEEIKGFLIAAVILVAIALFVPCMESAVRALRHSKSEVEAAPEHARDGFIA